MKKLVLLIVLILVFVAGVTWAEKTESEELGTEKKISVKEEKEWFNKGCEAYTAGNYDEAIRWFKKTIGISPNLVKAHYNIGLAYQKKGMLDEAITVYKRALAIYPDYAPAHHNLGNAYFKKDLDSLAADHLYKAGLLFVKEGFRDDALRAYTQLKQTKSKELAQALYEKLYPEPKQKKEGPPK